MSEFEETLKNAGDKLVVVDFTATWCGPCQHIKPKFHKLAEEETDVIFIQVDVDANEETASKCGIQCMPTFQFFKNNAVVEKMEGANEAKLRELVTKHK